MVSANRAPCAGGGSKPGLFPQGWGSAKPAPAWCGLATAHGASSQGSGLEPGGNGVLVEASLDSVRRARLARS